VTVKRHFEFKARGGSRERRRESKSSLRTVVLRSGVGTQQEVGGGGLVGRNAEKATLGGSYRKK